MAGKVEVDREILAYLGVRGKLIPRPCGKQSSVKRKGNGKQVNKLVNEDPSWSWQRTLHSAKRGK